MIRRVLLLVFAICGACSASFAQDQAGAATNPAHAPARTTLTLAQAEAVALKNNPQITIGKLRALEAQQYVREARSALLPTAYLSLTGVDSEVGSRIAAGGLNNPVVFPRAAAGATVSQLVTDFGRTTNVLSSSKFQAKAEDQNAAATYGRHHARCRSGFLQFARDAGSGHRGGTDRAGATNVRR